MKKIIAHILIGLLLISVVGCGGNKPVEVTKDETKAEALKEEPKTETSQEEQELTHPQKVLIALNEGYKEVGEWEYIQEYNAFILDANKESQIRDFIVYIIDPNNKITESNKKEWSTFGDTLVKLSESFKNDEGKHYSYAVYNPLNKENFLMTVIDGKVDYNFLDETQAANKTYAKDEYWEVPGQWKLKIDSVTLTDDRNQFSDKKPAQVVIIKYTYENLGYKNDIQDLFFTPDTVIDENGTVASTYPASTSESPKPTPEGAKCEGAEDAWGLTNESGKIKIIFEKYDNSRNQQKGVFEVEVTK